MSRVGKSSKPRARRPARKRVQLPEALDLTAAAPLSQSLLTHRGKPLTIKLTGPVEAWFEDMGDEPPVAKAD